MAVLNTDRANLLLMREYRLSVDDQARLDGFIQRRLKREPLQYIVGNCEFYGFEFAVSPAVLIPRPETELLVEQVFELAKNFPVPQIIDLGTGSGCIAITLTKLLPQAQLVAVDISAEALAAAKSNAQKHGVAERIDFRVCDFTQTAAFSPDEKFDLIVSNPPYVLENERPALQLEVRDWEPAAALYVGGDGLNYYRCILDNCKKHLRSGGWAACEMASQRSTAIEKLFREAGLNNVQIIQDLAGFDRHVLGQKPN